MNSQVRYISTPKQIQTEHADLEQDKIAKVLPIDESPLYSPSSIPIDHLYAERNSGTVLGNALHLLTTAVESLAKATVAHARGELIEADEEAMRCQAVLPELFCCRELGDGFGAVVNAVKLAFRNSAGIPLSKIQLEALQIALGRIRNEPYLTFESAVQIVTYLEDVGLVIDPPEFVHLAEALDVQRLP